MKPPRNLPSTSRPTVSIVCKFVHTYRMPFFDGLRLALESEGIELQLLYGKPDESERSKGTAAEPAWGTYCPNRFIQLGGTELQWQHGVLKRTRRSDLIVLEQASKLLVNYPVLARSKAIRHQKVAFWGHGKNIAESTNALGEAIKKPTTTGADWFFAYTESTRGVMLDAGFPDAQLTVVQNAVDSKSIQHDAGACSTSDQTAWRRRHDIPDDALVALALGSLYADKRPQFLVAASDAAHAADARVHTVVAGGGPDAAVVEQAAATRPWLHVVGPVFGVDKAAALATSACMVMPGVGGLVIVDAFAAGLPLVVAENPHHPPEFDYVTDGHNAVVLPADADPDTFGRRIASLVTDEAERASLGAGSRADADVYTIEAMVDHFAAGIRQALSPR